MRPDPNSPPAVGRSARSRLSLVLGVASGIIAVVTVVVPFFVDRHSAVAVGTGYFGYFVANSFGFGIFLLPLLLKTLNPAVLILVGTLGFTVDEVFAWYAGSVSDGLDDSKKLHVRIQGFVERRGLRAVFVLGLLPLPGIVYTVSGFAAGHFKIPLHSFFLLNFLGKLIRTAVTTVAVMILIP